MTYFEFFTVLEGPRRRRSEAEIVLRRRAGIPMPEVGDCGGRRVSATEWFWVWCERERAGVGVEWLDMSVSPGDVVMRICSGVLGGSGCSDIVRGGRFFCRLQFYSVWGGGEFLGVYDPGGSHDAAAAQGFYCF